jgi:hypothetical protein
VQSMFKLYSTKMNGICTHLRKNVSNIFVRKVFYCQVRFFFSSKKRKKEDRSDKMILPTLCFQREQLFLDQINHEEDQEGAS